MDDRFIMTSSTGNTFGQFASSKDIATWQTIIISAYTYIHWLLIQLIHMFITTLQQRLVGVTS